MNFQAIKTSFFAIILLISVLCHTQVWSQNTNSTDPVLDSLRLKLLSSKHDTSRIIKLNNMARYLSNSNPDSGIICCNMAVKIAARIKDRLRVGETHLNLGFNLMRIGKYDEAIAVYASGIAIADSFINNKTEYIKLRAKQLKGSLCGNSGTLYMQKGEYTKALQYFFEGLKIVDELGFKQNQCIISNGIGNVYHDMEDYTNALLYYKKSFDLATELNFIPMKAVCLDNLGTVSNRLGKADDAIEYLNKAIELNKSSGNINFLSVNYSNLATVLKHSNRMKEAIHYFKLTIQLDESVNNIPSLAIALNNLGDLYTGINNFTEAEKCLLRSLKIANEVNSLDDQRLVHQSLFKMYKRKGDARKSLLHFEKYITYRDSIYSAENVKKNLKTELKYSFDKKAVEDSVAHAKESEIKNAEIAKQTAEIKAKRNQQYALFGGLALVMVFAGFMYNRFKVTQKQKGIIEEQKEVVEEQKKLVEEKQKEILDSIQYARRIQMAQIPNEKRVETMINKLKVN